MNLYAVKTVLIKATLFPDGRYEKNRGKYKPRGKGDFTFAIRSLLLEKLANICFMYS